MKKNSKLLTISKTREILALNSVPKWDYCLPGEWDCDEGLGIDFKKGAWLCFSTERGSRSKLFESNSEHAVCEYFLKNIDRMMISETGKGLTIKNTVNEGGIAGTSIPFQLQEFRLVQENKRKLNIEKTREILEKNSIPKNWYSFPGDPEPEGSEGLEYGNGIWKHFTIMSGGRSHGYVCDSEYFACKYLLEQINLKLREKKRKKMSYDIE